MKINFDQIKNIAKDVSKEVVTVVGDKYLEIKANTNFDDGRYDEVIKAANEILKLDKFNYGIVLLKGKALMKQNKYDEAIDAFIDALVIDDTKIEPLLHIAAINELQGNIDDAIDIYNSIIKKDNTNYDASLGLARNYFIKKEYEKVDKYYKQAEPQNDRDYYNWGKSQMETGQYTKAENSFKQANKINPSREYRQELKNIKNKKFEIEKEKAHKYFNNKEYDKTIICFNRISNFPSSNFTHEDHYIWGLCLEKQGDEFEAYKQYQKANRKKYCDKYKNKIRNIEQKNKKDSDNFIKKANEYCKNNEYSKANTYFSKASKDKWSSLTNDNYYDWGVCLINLGNSVEAKKNFKKANNPYAYKKELLKSQNKKLLLEEAEIYYEKEDFINTIELIDRLLEFDPENIEALLMKGNILLRKNNQLAWDYYEKVLKLDPYNKKANEMVNFKKENGTNVKIDTYWLNIGIKELNTGNYIRAENALNKSLEFNPNNAEALSWLCVLYQNQKNYRKALEAINKSLNIDSKNDQAWFNKGQTLFWMGDFKSSIQCFNQAIRLNPDECEDALAIKGMCFVRLNKMSEANKCLRQCLEINPKNALAIEAIKHMPNFGYNDVLDIDIKAARKINVNPLLFAKVRHTKVLADMARDKGESITFEYDFRRGCILKHNNKKYFFNFDEIDAATVYVEKIQSKAMWNAMSDESKDEINSIIDDVMKEAGYK